jgi:Protein of unknown function (DUF2950)
VAAADAGDDRRFPKAVEMNTRNRLGIAARLERGAVALACAFALTGIPALSSRAAAQAAQHRTFGSPEDAVKALVETVRAGNLDQLLAFFGQDGKDLIASSDPATARQNRQVFTVAVGEQWHLEDAGPGRKTLVIGNEDWPFPVPLVKDGETWRFDTAAGKEEVLARRIGRNELEAIDICRTYAAAQRQYALTGHDGKPAGLYAAVFRSDAGKQNGLYWPADKGAKRSPLGDLVAQAASEGRSLGQNQAPEPFHGYLFKILTAQGAKVAGGAKSYVAGGHLSGGFALVAWPAQYDASGVMTFVINQSGVVWQKDLGPETAKTVAAMKAYDPDSTWNEVR